MIWVFAPFFRLQQKFLLRDEVPETKKTTLSMSGGISMSGFLHDRHYSLSIYNWAMGFSPDLFAICLCFFRCFLFFFVKDSFSRQVFVVFVPGAWYFSTSDLHCQFFLRKRFWVRASEIHSAPQTKSFPQKVGAPLP